MSQSVKNTNINRHTKGDMKKKLYNKLLLCETEITMNNLFQFKKKTLFLLTVSCAVRFFLSQDTDSFWDGI